MQHYLHVALHGTDTYSTLHTCSIGSILDNSTHIVVSPHDDSRAMQLKYHSMNKEEMNAIAEAQNKGDMDLLYKHPRLKSIAGQGVITIKLNSVDRLVHPSWWRGGTNMCKLTTLLSPPILNMQHSLQVTGVLAVVRKYLLSVSMILRCQNGATLFPPLPGGEERVAHMQKLGGLPTCSVHGVACRQWCRRCEGAWCTLTFCMSISSLCCVDIPYTCRYMYCTHIWIVTSEAHHKCT